MSKKQRKAQGVKVKPSKVRTGHRTEVSLVERFTRERREARLAEKRDPRDTEIRRRMIAALGRLSPQRFGSIAPCFENLETFGDLGQALADLVGPVEQRIGIERWAEILVAILSRFDREDDAPEQAADELLRVINEWASGPQLSITPTGSIPARVGMLAGGTGGDQHDQVDGKIVSACDHGCFIRDAETGEVAGFLWEDVVLIAAAPNAKSTAA